jgi:hypothetical protein
VIDLVDRARFLPARRQLALVYAESSAPAEVVGAQRQLVDGGATVRLVRRTRNMCRLFAELAAEGFDGYVSWPSTSLEVTPLTAPNSADGAS